MARAGSRWSNELQRCLMLAKIVLQVQRGDTLKTKKGIFFVNDVFPPFCIARERKKSLIFGSSSLMPKNFAHLCILVFEVWDLNYWLLRY